MFASQDAQSYADDNSLLFMETSAKTSMNVNEIFMAIGKCFTIKVEDELPAEKNIYIYCFYIYLFHFIMNFKTRHTIMILYEKAKLIPT